MTKSSLEALQWMSMTASDKTVFSDILVKQGITEATLRINSWSDATDGVLGSPVTILNMILALKNAGIVVNIDLHTWMKSSTSTYMTWDNAFDDNASSHVSKRATYISYVRDAISKLNMVGVKAFMVLNEPQAQSASSGENQFIRDVIAAAKSLTTKPVGVRFMCGYSPSTGHYAADIDELTDMLCRNTYWDPRSPSVSKNGTTEAKMNTVIARAADLGKELWFTEFGRTGTTQKDYIKGFVAYAKEKKVARIYCWAAQPISTGENYNIFKGTRPITPKPGFYELISDADTPPEETYSARIVNTGTGLLDVDGTVLKPTQGRDIDIPDTISGVEVTRSP